MASNDTTNAKENEMTTTQQVYAMCMQSGDARFTFHADNDKDASDKASRWARYHGLSYYSDKNRDSSDVKVRPAQGIELNWQTSDEHLR